MRRAAVALQIAVALLLAAPPASAQLPTGCTAPTPWDTFLAIGVGDRFTSAMMNRIYCVLNELGDHAEATGPAEVICQAVSLDAGARVAVLFVTASSLTGTEGIMAGVESDSSPPLLLADGVHGVDGTDFSMWVWNRDADNPRTGTACAHVVRP